MITGGFKRGFFHHSLWVRHMGLTKISYYEGFFELEFYVDFKIVMKNRVFHLKLFSKQFNEMKPLDPSGSIGLSSVSQLVSRGTKRFRELIARVPREILE
uniref:Uncharacterized protein n=1 Tax=Cacopsylla melanoneura TaxID=428564 RepID=A0A8D8RZS8_9HEMI